MVDNKEREDKKNRGMSAITLFMGVAILLIILGIIFMLTGGKDTLRWYKLRREMFAGSEKVEGTPWVLTQFGDASGKQNNFYILTSRNGDVVVIDGGWSDNAAQVTYEIKRRGGHVDAWILTHPHPDHIGAFNEVYRSGEVKIDAIYDNGLDYEYYDMVDEAWDEIAVYQEYLELTGGESKVHHVSELDELAIDNLKIKFYSAYSEEMRESVKDICNNSSLIFTVSADEGEQILFVGDCYAENIVGHVLCDYADEVEPTMAQMPHHGNSILPDSYYEGLGLRVCFFDAPAWLMEDSNYTTYLHRDAMEAAGAYCIDQSMAPTTVKLYKENE